MDERNLYAECIQKQLDEIDMLMSIYCNPGEVNLKDVTVISDFNEFLKKTDSNISALNAKLEFSIGIKTKNDETIDVHISLPHLYPTLENPSITLRSALVKKSQEILIRNEIENYISEMDKNDGYIYQAVTWLQDQIDKFLTGTDNASAISDKPECETKTDFERLWIYSHHIKSKIKRHDIIRNANNLNLTGFSRPGKPGIICVEGLKRDTDEFWKLLKAMQWQKITIRKIETKSIRNYDEIDKYRRFQGFREEIFTEIDDNVQTAAPMNMSLFMRFLDAHNSGYIKKDLFGFE